MPPVTPIVEKPVGEKDNVPMVDIPSGEFIMGTDVERALSGSLGIAVVEPYLGVS